MYLFITGVVIIITVIFFYFKKKFNYWNDLNVPYPIPSFPLGNFNGVGKSVHWCLRISEIYQNFKSQGPFCGIYFMTTPQVLVTDLDLVRSITIKDFNNFGDRGMYYHEKADPLSAHLFNIEGEKWKNLRNKLSPTFTSGKIKTMFTTVLDVTGDLKLLMTSYSENKTVMDVKDVCMRYTADVIGSCAFGLECNSLKTENSELMVIAKKVFDFSSPLRQFKFFFQTSFMSLSRKLNLRMFDSITENYFMRIIKDTIEYRENSKVERNDFMNLLLKIQKNELEDEKNNKPMTFNELAAQAFLFFFAGFETSSTTMNFCLYELAYNQKIQQNVRDEINRVLSKHDGKLTYEAVMELDYLGQVINETLRKHSPISTLFRKTLADYQVPGTPHIIKKGTAVQIPIYSIQNDPDIYQNPSKFDPDRFTAENIKERHPYSFLPFGEGPRNCIGMRFAILQTKLGLATMIMNFKLTLNSRTIVPLCLDEKELTMVAKGGIWLDIERIL